MTSALLSRSLSLSLPHTHTRTSPCCTLELWGKAGACGLRFLEGLDLPKLLPELHLVADQGAYNRVLATNGAAMRVGGLGASAACAQSARVCGGGGAAMPCSGGRHGAARAKGSTQAHMREVWRPRYPWCGRNEDGATAWVGAKNGSARTRERRQKGKTRQGCTMTSRATCVRMLAVTRDAMHPTSARQCELSQVQRMSPASGRMCGRAKWVHCSGCVSQALCCGGCCGQRCAPDWGTPSERPQARWGNGPPMASTAHHGSIRSDLVPTVLLTAR